MIALKDMAGLLTPYAAQELIPALKETVNVPIHLHTHDTSSIQSATYLKSIEASVDVIDVALGGLSGYRPHQGNRATGLRLVGTGLLPHTMPMTQGQQRRRRGGPNMYSRGKVQSRRGRRHR